MRKLNRKHKVQLALLTFFLSYVLIFPSAAHAARFGLTFHAVQVVDENNQRVTGITSVSIYLPGTTTDAAIYGNRDLDTPITQPMTTSSTNTTLSDGSFEWWGADGYSYSITDGDVTVASSSTFTSSSGTIVFTETTLVGVPISTYGRTLLYPAASANDVRALLVLPMFDVTDDGYDATGDGSTDDEVAIEAAITAAAVNGGTVYFPATGNSYAIDDAVTVPSNVSLQFAPGASMMGLTGDEVLTLNGGIVDTQHQIFQSTITVEGAPKINHYNVVWWGAVADTATNSSAAITAAIATAAGSNTHPGTKSPRIFFPAGSQTNGYYKATFTVTEGMHLYGSQAIIKAWANDDYAITVEYSSGAGANTYRPCVIDGLTIWGLGLSNGIKIDRPTQHMIISNCTFSNCEYAVRKLAGYGVHIQGCLFITGDYGFYAESDDASYPPTINEIVDCEFNSYDQSGIFLGVGADLTNISHTVIQICKGNGITLAGSGLRGSYRGVHLNHVWMEANGARNAAPVATIDIDGVTIEPVDLYSRDVANLTCRNMRIPVTWLKATHMRTYDCGYSKVEIATDQTHSVVALDTVSSVIHHNINTYNAVSDAGYIPEMSKGIRIAELSTGTGSSQPVAADSPHKTELSYEQTNLLGADASMHIDFTPNDGDSQTESVASGDTPMAEFQAYWTTTIGASMSGLSDDALILYNNVAITKEDYHVWSMALMADGDDLVLDMSWVGAPHRPRNILLTDGVWKTITSVWGVTDTDTPDLWLWNTSANTGSLRVSATQLVAFDTLQEAMQYANSNRYAMGGVTTGLLGRQGEIILLSTTTLDVQSAAQTTLYTVPTSYRCILDHIKIVSGATASPTAVVSFGQNGAATDFLGNQTMTNLAAQYDTVICMPVPNATPVKTKSYAAGTVIEADVTTADVDGGTDNTVYLYGALY